MFNRILVFHCNTYHPIPMAGLYIEQEQRALVQHNLNTAHTVAGLTAGKLVSSIASCVYYNTLGMVLSTIWRVDLCWEIPVGNPCEMGQILAKTLGNLEHYGKNIAKYFGIMVGVIGYARNTFYTQIHLS